jgi:hypothetical protein
MTTPLNARPQIEVTNVATAAEWLRDAIGTGELSGIFRREGELVHTPRIGEDGYIKPEQKGVDDGPAQVRFISDKAVKAVIDARYLVWRMVIRGQGENRHEEQQFCLFPPSSCTAAYEAARIGEATPNIRELRCITHTPTIRADGSILDSPGYDKQSGMLFLPDDGLESLNIPDTPTHTDTAKARELILKPIAEFPFVTDDDKAPGSGWRSPRRCGNCSRRRIRWVSSPPPTWAAAKPSLPRC